MFDSLLVANRGEIACRIIRTARRLGVRTVAVYSDADAGALHVAMADEAVRIGPAAPQDSYLSIPAILAAARMSGVAAVHPGYGFLAEKADFAEACAQAGFVFIGPPPAAIRAMGAKTEAKRIAEEAGVPVVPGYHGASQSKRAMRRAAEAISFPLLVKASAGGGGRGMRLVPTLAALDQALDGARREAESAFGDGRLLLERFITRARHVEVQVFGDARGNVVHLFERDCSIQRRHQKIVEECPAPGLPDRLRARMAESAVAVARDVGYVGAGTVEFIVDAEGAEKQEDAFYFMEMNARLQVEHPATELVTGLDLVEWQIRVAVGEKLPLTQSQIRLRGHAVEVRLCAEDPARDFLPAAGSIIHLSLPEPDERLRVDAGFRSGDAVTPYYDSLLAKLIVHGRDRRDAVRRVREALAVTEVAGVATNRGYLAAIAAHPEFMAGKHDTGFIERHHAALLAAVPHIDRDDALVLAAVSELAASGGAASPRSPVGDPHSPWRRRDGWRLFGRGRILFAFADREGVVEIAATALDDEGVRIELPCRGLAACGRPEPDGTVSAAIDGRSICGRVVRAGSLRYVLCGGESYALTLADRDDAGGTAGIAPGGLVAPLPSIVAAVHIRGGERVVRGQALLVLEAMKMEHVVTAPADGTVLWVHYRKGERVEEGAALIDFESA